MNQIRLLQTGYNGAAFNMGLDEAVMQAAKPGLPVLRLYGWKPPAVSIGYFQSMRDEVDVDACGKSGVDVVRRVTGGGAVFHDAELTYSFITREYPQNVKESYELVCGAVIAGLAELGVQSSFVPLNDIVSGGKKISGNAQTRKNGVLLQHGTILLEVDVDRMFSLLKVPSEKMRDKLVANVKERVTGIHKVFEETSVAVQHGFSSTMQASLAPDEPSAEELAMAESLAKTKYSADSWNFLR